MLHTPLCCRLSQHSGGEFRCVMTPDLAEDEVCGAQRGAPRRPGLGRAGCVGLAVVAVRQCDGRTGTSCFHWSHMSCGVSPWLQVAPLALGDVPIVPSVSCLLPEGAPIPPRAPRSSLRLPVCFMSPTFQLCPFSWEGCFPGLQLALCRTSHLGVLVLRPHVLRALSCRAAGAASAALCNRAQATFSREGFFLQSVFRTLVRGE